MLIGRGILSAHSLAVLNLTIIVLRFIVCFWLLGRRELTWVRVFIICAGGAFKLVFDHQMTFSGSLSRFLSILAFVTGKLGLKILLDDKLLLAGHVLSSHLLLLLFWLTDFHRIKLLLRLTLIRRVSHDFRLAKAFFKVFKVLLRLAWLEHHRRLVLTRLVLMLLANWNRSLNNLLRWGTS